MGVANDNCCVCGGGTNVTIATDTTTTTTTTSPTAAAVDTGDDDDGGGGTSSPSLIAPNPPVATSTAPSTSPPTTTSPTLTAPPSVVQPLPTPPPATLSPVTYSPTYYPTSYLYTVADWESLTYNIDVNYTSLTPGHTRFCGPKLVGGYDKAVAMCSPLTECGFVVLESHYGGNGNDCPEGLMCFADIICDKMPSHRPSSIPSVLPTESNDPTFFGQSKHPSMEPTISRRPSRPSDWSPGEDTMTSRGSYCGSSHDDALASCSLQITNCFTDDDCNGPGAVVDGWGMKRCYSDISCTIVDTSSTNGYDYEGVSSMLSGGVRRHRGYNMGDVIIVYGGMVVIAMLLGFHR